MTNELLHSTPLRSSLEQLASNEKNNNSMIGFSWPAINDAYRRADCIWLGDTPKDIYAMSIYQDLLPEELPQDIKDKVENLVYEGTRFYYFSVGEKPDSFEINDVCKALSEVSYTNSSLTDDYVGSIEESETHTAKEMSPEEFKLRLGQGATLFLTGAGISLDAGLPSGQDIRKELGVDENSAVDSFTRNLAVNSNEAMDQLTRYQELFFEKTTEAHKALEKIRVKTPEDIVIATENMDSCHENADSPVVPFINLTKIPNEVLAVLPRIVTVGLQADHTKLIKRYRKLNPNGEVIAININPPPYQYSADFFVRGKAEDVLRKIEE